MSDTQITLSEDEKADIIAKREVAAEKVKELEAKKAQVIPELIAAVQKTANEYQSNQNDKANFTRTKFEELQKISSDYELVIDTEEKEFPVQFYTLDKDGDHTYWDENSDRVEPTLIETIIASHYKCRINFIGKTAKDTKYYIIPNFHVSGSTYSRNKAWKLQVQGTNFKSSEERKNLLNVKTVDEKITDRVRWDLNNIEIKEKQANLDDRALELAISTYPHADVKAGYHLSGRNSSRKIAHIDLELPNGVKVELIYSEKDDVINFFKFKVEFPSVGIDDLIDGLGQIKI